MRFLLLLCLGAGPSLAPAASAPSPAPRAHLHAGAVDGTLLVHDDFPGPGGRLFVLLPPSYGEDASRRYPVLYGMNGQDLFDSAMAAGGEEWTLDEILARDLRDVPEVLVVGLDPGPDAVRQYAPPGSMVSARGDTFLEALIGTVKPFVDATYRTRPERDDTLLVGIGGSALFAVYGTWRRAAVFGGGIALDCPDVDAAASAWTATPPEERPWLWFEQRAMDKPRPSSTAFVAALQKHADVRVVVTGPQTSRTQRLVAALGAWTRR